MSPTHLLAIALLLLPLPSVYASEEIGALEDFQLSELRLTGVAPARKCQLAYFLTKDGRLHIATVGSRIGKNHGVLVKIDRRFVLIRELLPIADGSGWKDRELVLEVSPK
jgi:Tfp pilus assembly protein PilP